MKLIAFVIIQYIGILSCGLMAGGPFSVVFIPDSLIEEAHLVVREHETYIQIEDVDRAILTVKNVITILNESAEKFAYLTIPYDQELSKINSIEAKVYDHKGDVIKKVKKSDIQDLAYLTKSSLFTSMRKKAIDLTSSQYPYTIEYIYEKTIQGLNRASYWSPVISEGTSVEKAKLTIEVPLSMQIAANLINFEPKSAIKAEGSSKIYAWEIAQMVPPTIEPGGPGFRESIPYIHLMGADIKMGKVSGKMDSWKSFGQFYYDLNANRDKLPAEMEEKVKAMIEGMESPHQMIDTLYNFLQKNTRYVSVQLGIGGWQTYDADYVYQNRYGDCKALTNYMKSLLGAAGITSYATLVNAGEDIPSFHTEYVNDPFNHVILCVPMELDTVWLECTSSLHPAGYLGNFTGDRHVLVCTPEGGILTKTPASSAEENIQFRRADVFLDESGNAKVKTLLTESGFQQRSTRQVAKELTASDQQKWLERKIDAPGFSLTSFDIQIFNEGSLPICETNYEMQATNWASKTGNRIFLTPNVLERRSYVPDEMEERTQELVLSISYLDRDTIIYHLPEGFQVEAAPDMPVKISAPFGEYKANLISSEPGKLIYTREIKMLKGRYQPEVYKAYRDFYLNVVKQDKLQVVLVNKS